MISVLNSPMTLSAKGESLFGVEKGKIRPVESGCQRPARCRMLHRKQPMGRLPRLEDLSCCRLTKENGTHPSEGNYLRRLQIMC